MKLKEYTQTNTPMRNCRKHSPGFSIRDGRIRFNSAAAELIGLKENVLIKFCADEEENIYVEKVKDDGFPLKKDNKGYGLSHKELFEQLNVETNKTGIIAGKPTEIDNRKLWGLLVRNKV